jgi:hypothetical protein
MAAIRHFGEAIFNPYFVLMLILGVGVLCLCFKGCSKKVRLGVVFAFMGLLLCSTGFLPRTIVPLLV